MNIKLVWSVLSLVLVLLVLFFLFDRDTAEAPTDVSGDIKDDVEDVGETFISNFLKIAPPVESEDFEEDLIDTISERALAEIDVNRLSSEMALFVGVQDRPDLGVDIVDVSVEDEGLANMRVLFKYSGGDIEKVINLVKEGEEWKVDSVTGSQDGPRSETDFNREGNIVRNSPGYPEGGWYLVYEEVGAPALTEALIFTSDSICLSGGIRATCDPELLEEGERVEIKGIRTEEGVEVDTLHQL